MFRVNGILFILAGVAAFSIMTASSAVENIAGSTDEYAPLAAHISESDFNNFDAKTQSDLSTWVRNFSPAELHPAMCYLKGTDPKLVQAIEAVLSQSVLRFNGTDSGAWSTTVTDGGGLTQGNPITLTWSIVPDGTDLGLAQVAGEVDNAGSDLIAAFNLQFGSQPVWEALMQSVFDEWSKLTGITYVKVSDDGAAFPFTPGALGSRGDVRIGGRAFSGVGGVLAYNWFPNLGDMVLDTLDAPLYGISTNSFRFFRNTFSHEHGHGMGFGHSCPIDNTKIMEPIITIAFDHSAHDDIAHANRKYGDPNENGSGNDTFGAASAVGAIGLGTTTVGDGSDPNVKAISLDSATDVDYYSIDLTSGTSISVALTPLGFTYNFGDDPPGPLSCGFATIAPYNSKGVINTTFQLIDTDGSTVLASPLNFVAGAVDNLYSYDILVTGTYYLRVFSNDAIAVPADDQVQLYQFAVTSPGAPMPLLPFNPWIPLLLGMSLACLGAYQFRRGMN